MHRVRIIANGAGVDTQPGHGTTTGALVKSILSDSPRPAAPENKRSAERQALRLPARLTWKDQRGTTRFASVVTRDVSDYGVYVESPAGMSIPLYRLVQFQ